VCTDLCLALRTLERAFSDRYTLTATILITTYNITPIVAMTLAALRRQTYPAALIEVVIADDGSTDGIESLVSDTSWPWPIRLVRQQDEGFRLASIRNKGLLAARHDVIVNLDGDMLPMAGFVEAHLRWFHMSDFVVTIGSRRFVDTSCLSPDTVERDLDTLADLPAVESISNWHSATDRRANEMARFHDHPAPYNVFHGCNVAYRRDHAFEVGLYDAAFDGHWGYEDTELAYRLWRTGLTFVSEPAALALHQENAAVSFEARVAGDGHNFGLACARIPGFRDFKDRLRQSGRRPWW
jgi:glycosyltransferase involved in cell wall biosynthesis